MTMVSPPREYHCPTCGCDLRGQTVERCPECGFHYDLPALRDLEWRSFYSRFAPLFMAAKVLAFLTIFLVGVLTGTFFVALTLAVLSPVIVEKRILRPLPRDAKASVQERLIRRARTFNLIVIEVDVLIVCVLLSIW